MPNLNDIALVAESLEPSPLTIAQDRCVVVRNRNATCRRCAAACPARAIRVEGNEVRFDVSLCASCGACSVACPTEAITPLSPTDAALADAVRRALEASGGGRAVLACARASSKREADPARYAEIPCLARLGEGLLVVLAARKATEILLVDGGCSTCKLREHAVYAEAAIGHARRLIAAHGGVTVIRRVTGFPDDMRIGGAEGLFGTTRRGFFSDAVEAARDTAMTAAKVTLAQELGHRKAGPEIGERLRVTEQGTLPLIRVPRHEAAINALYEIGRPTVGSVDSRLFGSVTVDAALCNACGMCAVFCPTGALRRDPASRPNAPLRCLEFSASDCVQCGLCADVCWKRAISVDSSVDAGQLYGFEPVTFDLSGVGRKTGGLFGSPAR